jgi:hypothetical protein
LASPSFLVIRSNTSGDFLSLYPEYSAVNQPCPTGRIRPARKVAISSDVAVAEAVSDDIWRHSHEPVKAERRVLKRISGTRR